MLDADCEYRKGDFVRHPKAIGWGVGIVIEDQRGDRVKVFFENEINIKLMDIGKFRLDKVSDPGTAETLLINALVDEEAIKKGDQQPFPEVVKKFLIDFPGGFRGEMLTHYERNYKIMAHKWMKENLTESQWKTLIEDKEFEELAQQIKRFFGKTNLLASFELIKLNDALKNEAAREAIGCAFFDLLYGEEKLGVRLESTAKIFARYEIDKWTTITYPLFFCFPDKYMFVKPTVTQEAALNRRFDIQYSPQVNWNTYKQVLTFSKELFDRLNRDKNKALHPRDMIDVQSFMWCTYGKGWSAKDIAKSKRELGIG